MKVDTLDYALPEDLIARHPLPQREASRMLVVDHPLQHRRVAELVDLLPSGALVVVNDTRVRPARLLGRKRGSGGRVELLLVESLGTSVLPADAERPGHPTLKWRAMGRSSKRWRIGITLELPGSLLARVAATPDDEGLLTVDLYDEAGPVDDLEARLAQHGVIPLPPYLARDEEPADRERYQTVFARHPGAVAAPTAGLHFSHELLDALAAKHIERTEVTLHVGPGTFRPVQVDDLDAHPMHAETIEVRPEAVAAVASARKRGAPVVAVGTTVVRTLESVATEEGRIEAFTGDTRLLITPGYQFRVVDALLTNFHLPRSTLLALIYAFGGTETLREAYAAAVEARYRFYSYGDAMFIPRGVAPSSRPAPSLQISS